MFAFVMFLFFFSQELRLNNRWIDLRVPANQVTKHANATNTTNTKPRKAKSSTRTSKTNLPYVRLAPPPQAILRVKGSVCALFRSSLSEKGFVEIQVPRTNTIVTHPS